MATPIEDSHFDAEKKRVLHEKEDSSKKGNIDVAITDLIECINSHLHYYTTSSCSGRIIIFAQVNKIYSVELITTTRSVVFG